MRIDRRLRAGSAALMLAGALACALLGGCRGGGGSQARANVFRYAIQSPPTTLDPARVEDGDTIDLLQQVFEGLVKWDERSQVVPCLAERWDVSPDGRTYTFHLRKGVRFHNGRPFKASDVEYSITRALLPETLSQMTAKTYLYDIVGASEVNEGRAKAVSGIKVLDDYTVQITTDKRRPYFLGKLTYPTGYAVCREAIDANHGVFDEHTMVGTGPFKLQQYQAGYKVTLAANPDYFAGRPKLDGIERPILSDSTTRQTAYESGQTDLTDIDRAELSRILGDPALSRQLHEYPRAATWYLAMNGSAFKPFADRRVRRAFAMAINKPELVRLALKGRAEVANGILPPGVPGHDPAYPGLPYDPAQARKLLAEAGYPGGKGFPALTILYRQGYKFIEDDVMAMRSDLLQNLGIQVQTQQVEWNQLLTEVGKGKVACYHLRWGADYLDPQDYLSVLLRSGTTENTVGYSNPTFDRLCDQADTEGDPKKRLALYQQAEHIAVEDAPWVCLYYQHDVELQKPYVRGIRDCAMGHLPHITTTVR